MKLTRRTFLATTATFAGRQAIGSVVEFPADRPEGALFPRPPDGATVGINPPGLAWWRCPGAATYAVLIRNSSGRTVYRADQLGDPVHLPAVTLDPGRYNWDVEALSREGKAIARRGEHRFTVTENSALLPWEDPKRILARTPDEHPRYIFLREDLPAIRKTLETTRRSDWERVEALAERALGTPLPEPPTYHTFTGENRARMGYTVYFREFRQRVDATLTPLSVAFLLSGRERYGARAKEILLTLEPWGVDGPMSLLSPFGDEPGLSLARHGQRAYDFLYPLFDSRERQRLRTFTAARGRQILERLRKADYLARPAESHNGRLIAYLAEYAIVMKDEAPEADQWLDYSLRGLTTFYPHWGDPDGGWAEGVSYALSYNMIYLAALESLRRIGFDLYKRPFFRNVRKFFLYCTSPIGEMKPFGDGSDRGPGAAGAALLTHHARRFQDPACAWWAQQASPAGAVDPLISLVAEDDVTPKPPADLPSAMAFRGIGWAGLHSALDDPQRDTFFLFKSSPFGSVSHSHADQNSFAIMKGGHALAIPSGYYGPSYGMPHHAEWTRATKANNCVLVNGAGQVVRSQRARGRIVDFRHQKAVTYLSGDATEAYGGRLTGFLRHVLFLRPGLFMILDDLAAPGASRFEWLLHSYEKMTVDTSAGTVESARSGASLRVKLACEHGLEFSQTDAFDTPYNQGNPPEYHQHVENQWHFCAATQAPAAATRIAAAMVVADEARPLAAEWREHPGWLGVIWQADAGRGEIWAQVRPGAAAPSGVDAALLFARWQPITGASETLAF